MKVRRPVVGPTSAATNLHRPRTPADVHPATGLTLPTTIPSLGSLPAYGEMHYGSACTPARKRHYVYAIRYISLRKLIYNSKCCVEGNILPLKTLQLIESVVRHVLSLRAVLLIEGQWCSHDDVWDRLHNHWRYAASLQCTS